MLDDQALLRQPGGWARTSRDLGLGQRRGHQFKRTRDSDGFVVDGKFEDRPGASNGARRSADYITGNELRLRMELGLPPDMQLLVVSRR